MLSNDFGLLCEGGIDILASFSLTNSYENIRFDFYYRAGGRRVCRLSVSKEGKSAGHDHVQ